MLRANPRRSEILLDVSDIKKVNGGAKCCARGSLRAKAKPEMDGATIRNFVAHGGYSELKLDCRESKRNKTETLIFIASIVKISPTEELLFPQISTSNVCLCFSSPMNTRRNTNKNGFQAWKIQLFVLSKPYNFPPMRHWKVWNVSGKTSHQLILVATVLRLHW